MNIISLAHAREHLRIDSDKDSSDLQMKIDAATDAVIDYISVPITDLFDAEGIPKKYGGTVIRGANRVQQAILLTVGWLYEDREGEMKSGIQEGHGFTLPRGAAALLYAMRKPTCA